MTRCWFVRYSSSHLEQQTVILTVVEHECRTLLGIFLGGLCSFGYCGWTIPWTDVHSGRTVAADWWIAQRIILSCRANLEDTVYVREFL